MGWTHDLHVGETRPWPEGIRVQRGETGFDVRYYVPERYPHEWEIGSEFARYEAENERLRELVRGLRGCASGTCQRCVELYGECEHSAAMSALGIEEG